MGVIERRQAAGGHSGGLAGGWQEKLGSGKEVNHMHF
jgi:hypothetical protein